MRTDVLRRVRWGNVALAAAVAAVLATVVGWPRLAPSPPALPPDAARPLMSGAPERKRESRWAPEPRAGNRGAAKRRAPKPRAGKRRGAKRQGAKTRRRAPEPRAGTRGAAKRREAKRRPAKTRRRAPSRGAPAETPVPARPRVFVTPPPSAAGGEFSFEREGQ
jgi:hypothetical protein